MKTHAERVNFLWGIAELLRDHFKRGKYQDVILPLTVLRRVAQLRKISGYAFYSTFRYLLAVVTSTERPD